MRDSSSKEKNAYVTYGIAFSTIGFANLLAKSNANNCQITLAKSNQKVTLLYADTKTAQILNIPVDSPLMKYKGLMYDKQGHLAVFFENNMLIDRFGFIREVVL